MKTLKDIRDAIRDDMDLTPNDPFVSDAKINSFIKRAYDLIGNLYKWSYTEQVEYRTADAQDAGNDYFTMPNYWIDNSITKVAINSTELKPISWNHWQKQRGNFSERYRNIHLPFELKEGDTIEVHGHQQAWWVENSAETYTPTDTSESIFPYNITYAIFLYAKGLTQQYKGGDDFALGQDSKQEALDLVKVAYEQEPHKLYDGNVLD